MPGSTDIPLNPVSLLDILIWDMHTGLRQLERQRPSAIRTLRIKRAKEMIRDLYSIRDGYKQLNMYPLWVRAEAAMDEIRELNPEANGMQITVQFDPPAYSITPIYHN